MFCLRPSCGLPVYNTQYPGVCKVFFEENSKKLFFLFYILFLCLNIIKSMLYELHALQGI